MVQAGGVKIEEHKSNNYSRRENYYYEEDNDYVCIYANNGVNFQYFFS